MKRRILCQTLATCLALIGSIANANEIAITIDDLPYVLPSQTSGPQGLKIVQSINAALKEHGISAVGFAVGQQINRTSRPALEAFVDAGHKIGNHTWSHPDYGTLTKRQFRKEVRTTEKILRDWIVGPKYFRFPYLREGESQQAKQAAEDVLAEFNYLNVPVTIDNDEWQYNADYMQALANQDTVGAKQIGKRYLAHMKERSMHFQKLAEDGLGEDVPHILLIHMNQINADYLGELLDWYAYTGWTFITVAQAMSDPFYSLPDLYAGPRGLSQIERVLGITE